MKAGAANRHPARKAEARCSSSPARVLDRAAPHRTSRAGWSPVSASRSKRYRELVADPGAGDSEARDFHVPAIARVRNRDALQTNEPLGVVVKRVVTQASVFEPPGTSRRRCRRTGSPSTQGPAPAARDSRRGPHGRPGRLWRVDVEHARDHGAAAEAEARCRRGARQPARPPTRARDRRVDRHDAAENGEPVDKRVDGSPAQASKPENLPVAVSVVATAGREAAFRARRRFGGTSSEAPPWSTAARDRDDRSCRRGRRPGAAPRSAAVSASTRPALSTWSVSRRHAEGVAEPWCRCTPDASDEPIEPDPLCRVWRVARGRGGHREIIESHRHCVNAPASPPRSVAGSYHLELPLTSIAPGEFIVSIEATRGDERTESLVGFRIGR